MRFFFPRRGLVQKPPHWHHVLVTPSPSGVMGEPEVRRMDVQMKVGGAGCLQPELSPSPPMLLFCRTADPELHRFRSIPHKIWDGERKEGSLISINRSFHQYPLHSSLTISDSKAALKDSLPGMSSYKNKKKYFYLTLCKYHDYC